MGHPTSQFLWGLVAIPLLGIPLLAALGDRGRAPLLCAGAGALLLGWLALRSYRHERTAFGAGSLWHLRNQLAPHKLRYLGGVLALTILMAIVGLALVAAGLLRST